MARGRRDPKRGRSSGRQKRPSRSERSVRRRPEKAVRAAEHGIVILLPTRERPPERVVAHLGPTNSGKTHAALDDLVAAGAGVYAGPLRMLAQEAHRRLGARLGHERVGLITGEERVNEHAPILCCTVEMAPQRGELLVLDEIQWADDEERGSAWTRLMLAGNYREIRLLGALDALPLVRRAFPNAELRVFERKQPLEWVGTRSLRSLTKGTVVVAFSRRAVLALAGEVNRLHPGRVAVLYGAMPLSSRREEIERFISGTADVCVATDVLGHGVNLPCETLLFAETTKFDGEERRPLHSWELAQIAGRAGRFGLVERGYVGVLTGLGWGDADPTLVESALEPHVLLDEGLRGYRIVDEARIRPRLADLGVDDPRDLDAALVAWHRVALREWAYESWLAVESLQPIRLRLQAVQRRLAERGRRLSLDDTWKLVNAPVDEDNLELLSTLALAIAGDRVARPHLTFLLDPARLHDASLEDAEQAGREASVLRWFALQYPGTGGVTIERAAALEEKAAERVVARLRLEVESPTIGRCRSCGRSCPPWFPLCDRCAGIARRGVTRRS
ncbi:MAG: helicase-related protein [Gaiellaceae bacterium]